LAVTVYVIAEKKEEACMKDISSLKRLGGILESSARIRLSRDGK
jgi:hypothetical protein